MARKVTTVTKTAKNGRKTTTVMKDTGALSGKQKTSRYKTTEKNETKRNKRQMSADAQKSTRHAATAAAAMDVMNNRTKAEKEVKLAKEKTYQKAIDKWNGILKSTPGAADGTNEALEGEGGGSNNTGTTPWLGW